ncbi:magnesium transporter [Candidatus Woesearchaeota archaeon]|nr:magnesium transporter [Candidatus Woesearchaeota archaeon]
MNKTVLTIFRETFSVMIISNIISSLGGLALHSVEKKLLILLPILIIVPGLNALIGGFASIVCSKFTTMLYLGEFPEGKWWQSHNFKALFSKVMVAALISSMYLAILAFVIAILRGFRFNPPLFIKITFMTIISTLILVALLLLFSIVTGLYIYHKKHDPNSYLIPLVTSIADVATMALFSVLLQFFF